jgi:hypothetical protein
MAEGYCCYISFSLSVYSTMYFFTCPFVTVSGFLGFLAFPFFFFFFLGF